MFSHLFWLATATTLVSAAADSASPFYIYSTSPLNIPSHISSLHTLTAADIHHSLIPPVFSNCPTKHYMVVLQPSASSTDYDNEAVTPFLASLGNDRGGMKIREIWGQVSLDATINTILMDCLHHGITRVEELDGLEVKDLEKGVLAESVIFVRLPSMEVNEEPGRTKVLEEHDGYLRQMVERYFGGEDYTLAFLTEARDGRSAQNPNDEETSRNAGEGQDLDQKPLQD